MAAISDSLDSLLTSWGILPAGAVDEVAAALLAQCAAVGVPDASVSVRWARATVTASGEGCARLRWHADRLAAVARAASGGNVSEVRICPTRSNACRVVA